MGVTTQVPGFKFVERPGGILPTVQEFVTKDTATLTEGDLVNLETGEIQIGATADTALVGAVQETKAGVDSTTKYQVISNPDAIYSVYDANARLAGANLDISGATGAMTVAADANSDLEVVADSAADELTLVKIAHGSSWQN